MHSRAARRAASPSAKEPAVKSAVVETEYKPWLHSAQNAGIGQKKKAKSLSRQQKMRQQRGLEHAERNLDRLEKKVTDSKKREKKVNSRRMDWEELNGSVIGKENQSEAPADAEKPAETSKDDGMQGVAMLDLEQPLPSRVAETALEGGEQVEANAEPTGEDLDEIK